MIFYFRDSSTFAIQKNIYEYLAYSHRYITKEHFFVSCLYMCILPIHLTGWLPPFSGKTIPAGINLMIFCYGILRDPENYPNPDIFNPDRFESFDGRKPYSYVPFSAGPRNCIGESLQELNWHLRIFTKIINPIGVDFHLQKFWNRMYYQKTFCTIFVLPSKKIVFIFFTL